MASVRAFIAVSVDEMIVARLAALQADWRIAGADIGWVLPESLHLTLKFLGEVTDDRLADIGDQLRHLAEASAPFRLTFMGAGGFPNLQRPRVLWVGVSQGAAALQTLAGELDATMAALRFPPETRPYRAHLTLGRVKSPEQFSRLRPLVAARAEELFGTMDVSELRLLRSDLGPQGARYTALHQAAFTGSVPLT